jgi:hypothetical protein
LEEGFKYADDSHVDDYLKHVVNNLSPTFEEREIEKASQETGESL